MLETWFVMCNDDGRCGEGYSESRGWIRSAASAFHMASLGDYIEVLLVQHRDGVGWFRRRITPQSATGQEPKLFTMLHQGVRLGVPAKEQEALEEPESPFFVPGHFTGKSRALPNSV